MGDTSRGEPKKGGEETRVCLCGGEVIVVVDMVVKKKEDVFCSLLSQPSVGQQDTRE